MLVKRLTQSLWNTVKLEKRHLTSEPVKSQTKGSENDFSKQLEALDKDICLLVDENDNFLGTATKRECHKVGPNGKGPLHRAFSVFLFNKRGDMLIQRRASQKITYPNCYTNACCSHPLFIDQKEEDVIAAARRRLDHELGIPFAETDPELFTFITRVHYHDPGDGKWGEHEIDHILIFQSDVKVKPNSDEISEHYFIPKAEFKTFLSTQKGPFTPWFSLIRQHRLSLWWDNLHRLTEVAEPKKILKFTDC